MFEFLSGFSPELPTRVLPRGLAIVAALATAGCAQTQNQYVQSARVAGYVAETAQVESDGLPTQTAPTLRARQLPDDPTAPYSRNYGGMNPSQVTLDPEQTARTETAAERPYIPTDLPDDFRRRIAAAVDTAG